MSWVPPAEARIKVNCDASVKASFAAVACVAWNSSGRIIDGFGHFVPHLSSVLLAESLAIRAACLFAMRSGYRDAWVKSNCTLVVEWWVNKKNVKNVRLQISH